MKLLVVIVNYKTAPLALRAAEAALVDVRAVGGAITIVDNDSGDDSLATLRLALGSSARPSGPDSSARPSGPDSSARPSGPDSSARPSGPDSSARPSGPDSDRFGTTVTLIAAERNGGFGYGNNVAIRRALASADPPQYVYLLNPDATPDPGAIRTLVEFLDTHPDVGIVGSHIHNPDGSTHVSAFRFPSPIGELEATLRLGLATRLFDRWSVWNLPGDRTMKVDWVSGASSMIRREVLDSVGLFDENFFLYFEETDLCRRATEAGWSTWFLREASVEHEVGVATGIKDTARRTPPYWFQSRRYYFLKQGGRGELWLANLAWVAGFSLWRLRRRVQGKPDRDPPKMLADFVKHTLAPRKTR